MANELGLRGWRRVAYWLVENETRVAFWGIPLIGVLLAPAYWLGLWWGIVLLVAVVGFIAGWYAARRHWSKRGYVPKI
jgi:Na+-driven multidrug efflux pump